MKKYTLFILCALCCLSAKSQLVDSDPVIQLQTAFNQIKSMQQAVQAFESMDNTQNRIPNEVESPEKIYNTQIIVRDVQEIIKKSDSCVKRIQQLLKSIPAMKLGVEDTANLLSQCGSATCDCVNITTYGSKIFTNKFFKMGNKECINEAQRVLADLNKLSRRVGVIKTQAEAIQFNNDMLNAYIR